MPAQLRFGRPAVHHETITLHSGGEFKLHVQPPPFAAQCADWERLPGYTQEQLRACIVGWSDLLDESGQPVGFSWERFEAACVAAPEILTQAMVIVTKLYAGTRTEDHSKNSESPPADGSAAAKWVTDSPWSTGTPGCGD